MTTAVPCIIAVLLPCPPPAVLRPAVAITPIPFLRNTAAWVGGAIARVPYLLLSPTQRGDPPLYFGSRRCPLLAIGVYTS